MIILKSVGQRIGEGIADHFHIRRPEWIMLIPTFGMWIALQLQPTMFDTSPSFMTVSRWADEGVWAVVVLACGVARLAALTVNGTFHQFRLAPHLRFAASLVGLAFWSQWTLGFINAYFEHEGALSGVFAYGTFCVFEIANSYNSARDIGGERLKKKVRRNGL